MKKILIIKWKTRTERHHTSSINNNTVTLHQPIKRTYNISLHCTESMHDQPPHPASRILKHVGSTVRQADVQQYDSECSFGVLSVELRGRCVLVAPTVQSPQYLSRGGGEDWVTRSNAKGNKTNDQYQLCLLCLHGKACGPCDTTDHQWNHILDVMTAPVCGMLDISLSSTHLCCGVFWKDSIHLHSKVSC